MLDAFQSSAASRASSGSRSRLVPAAALTLALLMPSILMVGCGSSSSPTDAAITQTSTSAAGASDPVSDTGLARFRLAGRKCSQIITPAEVSAIIGRNAYEDTANAASGRVNDGPTNDGWGCTFDTEGNQVNDLMVEIIVSDHEIHFFTDDLNDLGPSSGLGPKTDVRIGSAGATVNVLAENALLQVSDSGLQTGPSPVSPDQLQEIARTVYRKLTR